MEFDRSCVRDVVRNALFRPRLIRACFADQHRERPGRADRPG